MLKKNEFFPNTHIRGTLIEASKFCIIFFTVCVLQLKKPMGSLKGASNPKIGDPFDHKLVEFVIKRSGLFKSDHRRYKLSNFRKAKSK